MDVNVTSMFLACKYAIPSRARFWRPPDSTGAVLSSAADPRVDHVLTYCAGARRPCIYRRAFVIVRSDTYSCPGGVHLYRCQPKNRRGSKTDKRHSSETT
jgi:hypothetical protein